MRYQFDTEVLNGLHVTIEFTIQSPDKEVGIFEHYIEDYNIIAVNGKMKDCSWIITRISYKEEQRILKECFRFYDQTRN